MHFLFFWWLIGLPYPLAYPRGCQGCVPPLSPIRFIFMQFLTKILSYNGFSPQTPWLVPLLSRKSLVHHYYWIKVTCVILHGVKSSLCEVRFSSAWATKVTLVFAFVFFPIILGGGVGLWMVILPFYECRFSGGDIHEVVQTFKPYLMQNNLLELFTLTGRGVQKLWQWVLWEWT